MRTILYTQIDQKVVKEWKSLWEKSTYANYTNSPQWFLSSTEAFAYKKFIVLAIYEKEQLIAVAALVKEKKHGVQFYTVAPRDFVCGVPFLIDYSDKKVVGELVKQLLQLGSIVLNNIPEEFLTELRKQTKEIDAIIQSSNYYLPVKKDSNGQVILNKRNKLMHQVKNIREKFTIRSFDGTSSVGMQSVFDLDKKSSKHGNGYNTFDSSKIKGFYKILAKNFKEHLLFNIMYFENKPVAYEIGFFIKKNYYGSQTAYDIKYKDYSPGKVIFTKIIDYLGTKDVKMWDLGSGEGFTKKLVTEEKRQLYQVILSENKMLRTYITNIGRVKRYSFEQSKKFKKLYSFYRKIKKLLPSQNYV